MTKPTLPADDSMSATLASPSATIPDPRASRGSVTEVEALIANDALVTGARYDDRERLGQGGMGEVRLCLDRRIGRDIAMKVVRVEHAARDDIKTRFVREARVQGQLEHPAIVPVYDLGIDGAGALYFTMKRVRGVTLESIIARLRNGELEATAHYTRHRLLTAFGNVCLAVDFAHARGVLHRDLKPANIMLGDFGEVYVLDWGLAKIGDAPEGRVETVVDSGASIEKTAFGAMMGTPGYMAPEQVRGEGSALDARTDVYALGTILFELLALRPLHQGATLEALTSSTLAGAERLSFGLDSNVAPELGMICDRATTLEPSGRFQSTREIQQALERFLEGDRDVERRRQMAVDHARSAAEFAKHALSTGAEVERRSALREVSRALALDPTNVNAMRTFVQLLTEPPRVIPEEARQEIAAAARASQRTRLRAGAVSCFVWCLLVPFGLLTGIGVTAAAIFLGLWVSAGVGCLYFAHNPEPLGRTQFRHLFLIMAAVAGTSVAFGPFILVPALCTFGAIVFMSNRDTSRRWAVVLASMMGFLLPLGLEWLGLVPASYRFDQGVLSILPRMIDLSHGAAIAALVVTNLLIILLGGRTMATFRDEMTTAEQRLYLQAWQLRQLVPADEPAASSVTGS